MTTTDGGDRTVLIVDDEEAIRTLISIALRRASFVPIGAASGEEALAILETTQPAIAVVDMTMPGMSGLDVIRALRGRPATATLPILLMTGSGDRDSVLHALAAGADDFLAKPIRLDELVARLEAHIRTQQAWSQQVELELRARADVVGALGRLILPADRHDAALALARELGQAARLSFVAIIHLIGSGRFEGLATFRPGGPVERGEDVSTRHGRYVMAKAREGPWIETARPPDSESWMPGSWPTDLDVVACAPIYAGRRVVGLLVTGLVESETGSPGGHAKLLAEAIDFANMSSVAIGGILDQHGRTAGTRARLARILSTHSFFPVFQPIVDLRDMRRVGYEALTRFDDGMAPDIRFAEAAVHDLDLDFEAATMEAAIDASRRLPSDAYLALNTSPALALDPDRLGRIVATVDRPIVLELTEHVPIEDYPTLRAALRTLDRDVRVSVDDAGAGFASFRHILELRPQFVKLDMSIVRGIEGDPLRQSLVAGLVYFASRTGSELIAEGIESAAEAAALRDLSIGFGQGYLLGRPEPLA